MKNVRVIAHFLDEGLESLQVMVFDAVINDDDEMRAIHVFGYSIDDDEDKARYPFVITFKNKVGRVDWGGYAEDGLITTTNILEKKIKVGQFFTRVDMENGMAEEYTYRIKEIIDIAKI